jgi:hypothetical protein
MHLFSGVDDLGCFFCLLQYASYSILMCKRDAVLGRTCRERIAQGVVGHTDSEGVRTSIKMKDGTGCVGLADEVSICAERHWPLP